MPVQQTTPYDTAEDVLQLARTMCNDAALSIAGDILSDSQPYTFVMLEGCYEYLQDRLMAAGVNSCCEYAIITGLLAVASTDPTTQVQLSYTGYFDGVANHNPPVLPADLLEPLQIWERHTGVAEKWIEVVQAPDAINRAYQTSRFQIWDWETDILYLQGATQSNDLKVKYLRYASKLTTPTSPVQITRSKSALAALVAEAAAVSRGGTEAATAFHAYAERDIEFIINRTAQKEQRAKFVRQPFRNRGRRR